MKKIYITLGILAISILSFSQQAYLGVVTKQQTINGVDGARVSELFENAAASIYGLQVNDVITHINQEEVNSSTELKTEINKHSWGEKITVSFIRNNQQLQKEVVLGGIKDNIKHVVDRKERKKGHVSWVFNNEIEVKMVNNTPIQMIKVNTNGVADTFNIPSDYLYQELPSNFLDLHDKLYMIKDIQLRQKHYPYPPFKTIYIKTFADQDQNTSVKETKKLSFDSFTVYPNPTLGLFTINLEGESLKGEKFQWEIFDLSGKRVASEMETTFTGKYQKQISIEGNERGVYMCKITCGNEVFFKRIILN